MYIKASKKTIERILKRGGLILFVEDTNKKIKYGLISKKDIDIFNFDRWKIKKIRKNLYILINK